MIRDNIVKIRQRVALACVKCKRDPASVTIIAVSKGRTAEDIRAAIAAGITDIGENKVQEALLKYNAVRSAPCAVRLHMVGHLQANKAKEAVGIFDLIHSVDSLRLAKEIDKQAAKINKVQDILIEVNTSSEASKFGFSPEEAIGVIEGISKLKNIRVEGLMAIAPITDNPESARPYFRKLKELSQVLKEGCVLSMGMTDDFEAAIEEGSTMLRLGRAIFEE